MLAQKHLINLVLSLILATAYTYYTPYDTRGYDAKGHIQVVELMAARGILPLLGESWESYHPPLYYLTAFAWDLLWGGHISSRNLQGLALVIFFLTALIAGVFFRRYPHLPFLASFSFLLIPGYLFFSARINNDVMLPLMGMLVYMGSLSYWDKPGVCKAFLLGLLAALAMAIKLNAFAIWLSLGSCLLFGPSGRLASDKCQFLRMALALMPGALFLAGWMLRSYLETGVLFYSNALFLTPTLSVPTTAYKFFGFDFKAFLSQPSTDPFGGQIRDSFWTYLFSTYLIGEFAFPASWTPLITTMRTAFLLVIACLLFGVMRWRKNWHDPLFRASFIYFGWQLLFVVLIAIKQPFSCSMDARYLAPALLPLAVLIGLGWRQAQEATGLWNLIARFAQVLFPALVSIFYILLFVGGY